jgi:hypothetical protein
MVCLYLLFFISKLGNISDINRFMTWFHLEFIEKLLEFRLYIWSHLSISLYKYFIFTEYKIWSIKYFCICYLKFIHLFIMTQCMSANSTGLVQAKEKQNNTLTTFTNAFDLLFVELNSGIFQVDRRRRPNLNGRQ